MGVSVDEAGEHRPPRGVDDLGPLGHGHLLPPADGDDPIAF